MILFEEGACNSGNSYLVLRKASLLGILFLLLASPSYASWWESDDYYHGFSQVPIERLLTGLIRSRVLFIDTREHEEYREGHIPGARHLTLAMLDNSSMDALKEYQYVVPYCVKDFRAFEVARKLMDHGLENVVLMEPSGFKGWKSLDLPVVTNELNYVDAIAMLKNQIEEDR